MRINKFISETGYYSRRETNRLIAEKRITVNGEICEQGQDVDPDDIVLVDGKPIPKKTHPIYIALNKPVGITCTAAKHIEGNIIDFVNYPERIFPIGRLDKASQGLILMTNDGDIVNKMMRSEHGHEKEYIVTVDKPFDDAFLKGMARGVTIRDGKTNPCDIYRISDLVFRIILTQGMNRQIRRMCRAFGYTVTRLERIRIMNITIDGIETGQWRDLTEVELSELLALLG
ncbi:pseudouridine synthase [Bacillus sp. 123MFChir2]|uniref:pseudouridine synthase n=1 Tax=Bacillus sp. 123MFChir2 TaxID=1169144 RepID=UPI00037DDA6E|nr:pseudouridine synthase [Bacillus sp. 123MFChir2]